MKKKFEYETANSGEFTLGLAVIAVLFFLTGCSDLDGQAAYNAKRIDDLKESLNNCQNEKFHAKMDKYNLEAKLAKYEEAENEAKAQDHKAKYKASNKNLKLSDLVSGAKFLVDENDRIRIFIELPGNRYSFIIDDENKISDSTLMGIVSSKKEALDYAIEYGYGRIK